MLTGCQKFDPPEVAGMTELEKASYLALGRYFHCMAPFVAKAKSGPRLSDDQVNALGYRCLPQLQDAARKREHYFTAEPKPGDGESSLSAPTPAARIRLHEKDLAASFWCDFRRCLIM